MKDDIEMGSEAMISYIKTGFSIQKLIGGIHIQTQRLQGDLISLLLYSQNRESKLKNQGLNNIAVKICLHLYLCSLMKTLHFHGKDKEYLLK
jgi:hypothetical protein